MPVEIEAKMKLPDVAPVLARLQALGAAPLGDFLEENIFFDTPARTLLAADQGLRLRVSQNLATGQSLCVITHKGPNQPGQLKSREETELTVADPHDAARLLQSLGYIKFLSFQKHRRSWNLDACRIELDRLPHLGHFLEIEGPSEPAIMSLREKLNLATLPLITTSYAAMLAQFTSAHHLPPTDIKL